MEEGQGRVEVGGGKGEVLRGRGREGGREGGEEGVEEGLVVSDPQGATLDGGHGPTDILVTGGRGREGGRGGGEEGGEFGFEGVEVDDAPWLLTQGY